MKFLKRELPLSVLLVIQGVALILYAPSFLRNAAQAIVLPPSLFALYIIALIALNSGGLSPEGGRSALVFLQGISIVARLITLLPNLKLPNGQWNWLFLITHIISIVLSWYAIIQIEERPPRKLLFESLKAG